LEALELSKESGSLPAVEDMKNDSDLVKVKNMPWFKEFLEKMVDPEPEVVDKTKVSYDVEGNVVGKKRTKQKFATEYASEDGNIYDVEGNVIGQVEPSQSEKGASTDSKSSKETAESAKVTEKK
jgi:hypothetical protein